MLLIYTILRLKMFKKHFKKIFLSFLVCFFLFFFVPNTKIYLAVFLFFFLLCFFVLKKSVLESTILVLLLALPFEKAIREWSLYSSSSYSLFFGITPKIIIGILLCFLLLVPKNRYFFQNQYHKKPTLFLLIFYGLTVFTSIFFQNRTVFVFTGFLRIFLSILIYLIGIFLAQKKSDKIFSYYIASLTVFLIFFSSLQLIKQRPLGKFIELTPGFSQQIGYLTTDGIAQYRVSGFISHPVYFGSFLSMLIPILISIFIKTKNKTFKAIYLILTLLLTVITLGTLSRSTWINLSFIIISFLIYFQKSQPYFNFSLPKFNPKIRKIFMIIFLLVTLIITPKILTRIKSIPELFTNKEGSFSSRLDLVQKSLKTTFYRPFTGVGLNNFSFENYDQSIPGFAAPPHNTFLIFLSELGLPATIFFLLFTIFSLKPNSILFKKDPLFFGIWLGIITFIISSQFHPLFNLDPSFDIFMLLLGYYSIALPR